MFPKEPMEKPLAYLTNLAQKRGLPYPRAVAWAREETARYSGKKRKGK